jgi:glutamate dehydrogenase (NADP+)
MRFCQAFACELQRHIGSDTDIPAGDIGVGAREVGYMAGMVKKLGNRADCVFTGKGLSFGGSLMRPEATGFGTVYFAQEMLKTRGMSLEGMRVSVSGSGNVAQYAIAKAMELGAKVLTASDSSGTVLDEQGFTPAKLAELMDVKNRHYGRISDYAARLVCPFCAACGHGKCRWRLPCPAPPRMSWTKTMRAADCQRAVLRGGRCQHAFHAAGGSTV